MAAKAYLLLVGWPGKLTQGKVDLERVQRALLAEDTGPIMAFGDGAAIAFTSHDSLARIGPAVRAAAPDGTRLFLCEMGQWVGSLPTAFAPWLMQHQGAALR